MTTHDKRYLVDCACGGGQFVQIFGVQTGPNGTVHVPQGVACLACRKPLDVAEASRRANLKTKKAEYEALKAELEPASVVHAADLRGR